MKILFIHQNFPAQFMHLAPALAARGHQVVATTMSDRPNEQCKGVEIVKYAAKRGNAPGIHPWLAFTESKVIRGEALFRKALELKSQGFSPDLVIAHPGWGESLFIKEVWPNARVGLYCEFYYLKKGYDYQFDPEFGIDDPGEACHQRLKNINYLLHFEIANAGISPTQWQASAFPERFRRKISVIHDGIDTNKLVPNPAVNLTIGKKLALSRKDQVITFVSRNLEPYRGYHIFMRALPQIMERNPHVRVLVIGGNGVSYGAKPPEGTTWASLFFKEVKERLDLERINYLGQIPYEQYVAVMQCSSVHVYLTYPFVLSWSLIEAMSMGCAIVASNTKPVLEVIDHNHSGLLVDFFDTQGIADAVTTLLHDRELRHALGKNARVFAQKTYDLHSVCLPQQIDWVENLCDSQAWSAEV